MGLYSHIRRRMIERLVLLQRNIFKTNMENHDER